MDSEPLQRIIAGEHRDRLIAAGCVLEVVQNSGSVGTLTLTGAGIRRLESGK